MNSMAAMAMGIANRDKEMMVFDWDKAARLILQHQPKEAEAGLRGDWAWTGGTIYENGQLDKDSYTYLSSTWAMPILRLDNVDYECYIMESQTEWGHDTKWPQSALNIMGAERHEDM